MDVPVLVTLSPVEHREPYLEIVHATGGEGVTACPDRFTDRIAQAVHLHMPGTSGSVWHVVGPVNARSAPRSEAEWRCS